MIVDSSALLEQAVIDTVAGAFNSAGQRCSATRIVAVHEGIYDNFKNELFCARDQFGIKPFYYYRFKNEFWFSSEIKSFFVIDQNIKKNEKSIYRYINSEYHEHINETFYKNIFKIKPGHFLIVKKSKIFEKQFWNFEKKYHETSLPKKLNDRKHFLKYLIDQSVKKSMVSDVPISVASSGGLDSSVLQLIAKKYNPKLDLISWVFKENEFSEAVCLNSAAALIVSGKFDKFEEGFQFSKNHILSSKALQYLKKIQTT